ncbi:hypothetical protein HFP57_02700 [Parasphingopyxis algicola]|uniref:hypothetical protein n=1 Tax=Parasphingopyxis algicola TaxID=2026624 RepID=UPI0015A25C0D|nr:hypothetical protein [Parasphingopyxis algicola]QLC24048.1 hypothetical protein HFP57_02700 [Parasphingopyxis algicola]
MSTRLKWVLGILGIFAAAALGYVGTMQLGLGEYQRGESESSNSDGDLADMTPGERLCASQTTTDSIRRRIFARARTASSDDGALLSRLEGGTVARMENPRLIDFDEGLEQARCEGRLILELPRGTEPAFNYSRRLNASLEYIAQPAPDGRGTIYRMSGADDLIDRLADADLVTRRTDPDADDKPLDISMESDKDEFDPEFYPEFDEPAPGDPGFQDSDAPPPEDLLPPVMQEDGRR